MTNPYFNNYDQSFEQQLIEDLVVESIFMHGMSMLYLPRTLVNKDAIYGEDAISEYNNALSVDMYIKGIDGFQGQGDFLSKFGIQIRDNMTLQVARRTFSQKVGGPASLIRPRESDLIWFPLVKKVFMIKFVEHESIFYQMGALQLWDLDVELFEYSNERFRTGIPEVDALEAKYSIDEVANSLETDDDDMIITDENVPLVQDDFNFEKQVGKGLSDNKAIQKKSDEIIDFSEKDPFSENGVF